MMWVCLSSDFSGRSEEEQQLSGQSQGLLRAGVRLLEWSGVRGPEGGPGLLCVLSGCLFRGVLSAGHQGQVDSAHHIDELIDLLIET